MARRNSSSELQQDSLALTPIVPYQGFGGTDYHVHYQSKRVAAETLPSTLVTRKAANDETDLPAYERLAFAAEVSIRYHARRKTHFENVFKLMMLGVILLSGWAFLLGIVEKAYLGLGVIGLAAGTLVWNVTARAREHDVLRSEYQTLLDQIRLTNEPSVQDIKNWRHLRQRIQTKEPPIYWAVANDCYYEVARSWDIEPRDRGTPPILLRPFMNWFQF
jgi:hypothetical protein